MREGVFVEPVALAACTAENHNGVSCAANDCGAACVSLGFPGGSCVDGPCAGAGLTAVPVECREGQVTMAGTTPFTRPGAWP